MANYDIRKIKSGRCYFINELAAFGIERRTFYRWRKNGLKIVDEDEKIKSEVSKGDKLRKAYKISGKLSTDRQAMIDYLTIIGKRPGGNSKIEFLISEIDKQIDSNLNQFLDILEDPDYDTRLLIAKAIQIKAIIKDNNGKYRLPEGDELCKVTERNNLSTVINYLNDLANQDIRLQLEALVEKSKL